MYNAINHTIIIFWLLRISGIYQMYELWSHVWLWKYYFKLNKTLKLINFVYINVKIIKIIEVPYKNSCIKYQIFLLLGLSDININICFESVTFSIMDLGWNYIITYMHTSDNQYTGCIYFIHNNRFGFRVYSLLASAAIKYWGP